MDYLEDVVEEIDEIKVKSEDVTEKLLDKGNKKMPYNANTLVQCYFCGDKMDHCKIKSHMTEIHGRFKSIMYGTGKNLSPNNFKILREKIRISF